LHTTSPDHPGPITARPGASPLARAAQRIERIADGWFGAGRNPFRQLGAIGFWLFWVAAATGTWLFIFFETSVTGAHASIERLADHPWLAGALTRSLHRYSSDALILVMTLHALREFAHGKYRAFRRFSWITGVSMIVLVILAGAGGYALVWDARAQWLLVATGEWLAAVPGMGAGIVRNFVAGEQMVDRFFSLVVFLHIAVPLILLAVIWLHLQRLTHAVTRPHRDVGIALATALVTLSLAMPATSMAPADLLLLPPRIDTDWFYLFPFPLLDALGPTGFTLATGTALALLVALPWLGHSSVGAPAMVDPTNCNGCRRCFADCPYEAVTMVPHAFRPGREQAMVRADRCAACGICTGACPSSAAFRSIADLVTGIDLPGRPIDHARNELVAALRRPQASPRLVIFRCDHAAPVDAAPGAPCIDLTCAAQLPPSFVDFALRNGADGVVIVACPDDDCRYRLGARWTHARIAGTREPALRRAVPRDRILVTGVSAWDAGAAREAIERFRRGLRVTPTAATEQPDG